MIKLLGELPHKVTIACSGGSDSMSLLNFCRVGKRDIQVLYVHHKTEHGADAYNFIRNYCVKNNLPFITREIGNVKAKGESEEEYWRNERYKIIESEASSDRKVLLAHHLDDVIETWIMSSFHGKPTIIPYMYKNKNPNIIRPFLQTSKEEIIYYIERNKVEYIHDESNDELHHARNRIRHMIVPEALKINPGIHKVVRKKVLENFQNSGSETDAVIS